MESAGSTKHGTWLGSALAVACLLPMPGWLSAAEKPVDFNRQIRPLLASNCFACHGPDAEKRDSELRLDTREGAFALLDGRAAVVAGQPDQSELLARITADDPDKRMPPADSGKQLTADQIALLRRWIAEGATWEEHWAYRKPQRPQPPSPAADAPPAASGSPRHPIDAFVRARLAEQGLQPAAEADRATLVRRLYLDLTGLPPKAGEVDAFVRDATPDAYERLVDSLLASPHYGERMAQYWLDLVRYADSGGYHSDNEREVWMYRDYVIAAFNNNKPFDRFTLEQLAGDLLPDASDETRIASGYNRLLQTTEEGGAQAKEYLAKYAADRVRNVSSVWLASTLGCAECHHHKFDPFTTNDFYNLAAFFADLKENAIGRQEQTRMPSPEQASQLARFDAELADARRQLDTPTPELEAAQARWEETVRSASTGWTVLRPATATSAAGAKLTTLDDGSLLASDKGDGTDTYTLSYESDLTGITDLRLEALRDDSLPAQGPGRASNGNFVLSELQVTTVPKSDPLAQSAAVVLENATADHQQQNFPITAAVDGNPATGWAILPAAGKDHVAIFELKEPLAAAGGSVLSVTLSQQHGSGHNLGRLRLSASQAAKPVRVGAGLPPALTAILNVAPAERTPEQQNSLAAHYRSIAPELVPARTRLADIERSKAELLKQVPTTLLSSAVAPREMRILPRGNWLSDDGEIVSPSVPAFIAPLNVADRRPTRLDLARWITSADNPLTARVFVNRLWKLTYGQGLVKSLEDFGSQGVAPTHAELLDWLAAELVESGWNVKHVVRLLVTSDTYRQSSVPTRQQFEADPDNKWLARQGRFRLDAEVLRDSALAVSGLLQPRVGGPSVKPYQPEGYWIFLNFPTRSWTADMGENQFRRGLYTWWQRTFLHPSLLAFDAPSREECTVDRPRSNTPLQALVLLNDPSYVEAARVLAARMLREGGPDASARIQWAFRTALARPANEHELKTLTELAASHRQQFAGDTAAADRLLGVGQSPAASDLDRAELAAWTSVARVMLNLHEFVTRN